MRKKYLFPKMSKNHPKIYTKPPNGGYGNKQRDLVLLKTWLRYWQKGRVKRLWDVRLLILNLKCQFSKSIKSLIFLIIWLAPRAGKMTQIARCDWLLERARWSHLARPGLPALSRKQNYPKSHIINPLLTQFARSRWLGIGLVFFAFMDLDFVSVHKHAKK